MKDRLLSISCLVLLSVSAFSAPRLGSQVTKVGRNDGNTRVGIVTTCATGSWGVVAAARPTRRRIFLMNIASSGGNICLGTATMEAGLACNGSSHGIELGTSAYYEDSNEGAITCRARAGSGTAILKGFDLYDSAD